MSLNTSQWQQLRLYCSTQYAPVQGDNRRSGMKSKLVVNISSAFNEKAIVEIPSGNLAGQKGSFCFVLSLSNFTDNHLEGYKSSRSNDYTTIKKFYREQTIIK